MNTNAKSEGAKEGKDKEVKQNIVLVGFMGSGKSTVGERVAKNIGFMFVDTDSLVEKLAGMAIPEIFKASGEAEFRIREQEALTTLSQGCRLVISTGGGIVTTAKNRAALKALGFVVWLSADEECIYQRVSKIQTRPLLQTAEPKQTIRELMRHRNPLYKEVADIEIETSDLTIDEIAIGISDSARVYFANQP